MRILKKLFEVPNTPYALPVENGGDGWDEWREKASREYPVRHFLSWTLNIWIARTWNVCVADPIYYVKCALWHRYNVVKCKSLPSTWCDRDVVLLHSSFQVLTDFIEKEEPWEFDATDDQFKESYPEDEERLRRWIEIRRLYYWWKVHKYKHDDDLRAEEDEMLHRLIAVRGALWT